MLNNLKLAITSKWNLIRAIRLALAIFVLLQSWHSFDIFLGLIGGFILLQTLLNVGCCSSSGCGLYPMQSKKLTETEDVSHEEIKP